MLFAACVVSVLLVARSRLPRFEAWGLGLFVLVVFCIGLGGALAEALHDDNLAGDGRSLIACALGPLTALLWRDALQHRFAGAVIGISSAVLLFTGLAGQALALHGSNLAVVVVASALVLVIVVGVALGMSTARRARLSAARLQQNRIGTEAASALLLSLAAAGALVEVVVGRAIAAGAWSAVVAIAVCCVATARVAPLPLSRRDVLIVVAAAIMMPLVVPLAVVPVAVAVVAIAVIVSTCLPHGQRADTFALAPALTAPPPAVVAVEPGLGGLSPLFDDLRQRRPQRPRVLSRTGARRLVDAAIASAWRAQPDAKGRPPVDVVGGDEADLDGDPAELAEALCAIVDGALRELPRHPKRRITIAVRATAQTIAFEVDGGAEAVAGDQRPFFNVVDGEGFGVGLARARLLVERHGGQLSIGQGESAVVHVSLPRRLVKTPFGVA